MATPTYEELQSENRRLRERLADLERELAQLRAENAQLRKELATLRDQLAQDQENDPPPFVKPRRRAEEKKPPGRRERLARFGEWAVQQLTEREWTDPECHRIAARLRKHLGELFTYVRRPGVEATNNGAERALRPYVVKRKISGGHRTWAGARKHTILLSLLETCRRRGEDFRTLVEGVLRQAIASAG